MARMSWQDVPLPAPQAIIVRAVARLGGDLVECRRRYSTSNGNSEVGTRIVAAMPDTETAWLVALLAAGLGATIEHGSPRVGPLGSVQVAGEVVALWLPADRPALDRAD